MLNAVVLQYRGFWAYYVLCFLFLALLPILALVFNQGSMDFSAAAVTASESTGVGWTSNIVAVLRLASVEPVLLLTLLGSLAPALAAFAVLFFLNDGALWTAFYSRFRFYRHCSVGEAISVYIAIFALLVPCLFLIYELRELMGLEYARSIGLDPYLIGAVLTIAFLDQGALLEEVGWRGFAGPELQRRLQNPVLAALLIGVCWGLWHVPRDIAMGVVDRIGVVDYIFHFMPAFILGTISVSVVAAYFMNRLGGSIVAAIVVHGVMNDAMGISGVVSMSEALTPLHQITKNLPFAVVAMCLIVLTGGSLGIREIYRKGV